MGKNFYQLISVVPFLFLQHSVQPKQDFSATKKIKFHYDLSHPAKTWTLPKELKEISGQVWLDANHLLVIEDLHPDLYILNLDKNASIEKTIPFKKSSDKKIDIEDIAIVKNNAYALWSHGIIYKIKNWQSDPDTKKLETPLSKENNTEGLCYDPVSHNLLIACKNESDVNDQKKSTRSVLAFDLKADSLISEPFLLIRKKDFKKIGEDNVDFYPSAVAVHPVTHDVYILSTKISKCMAQYSYKGELKSLQYIDKNILLQPEGICFAPDGTLYISSEGKHGEPAVIMQFAYSK